MVYGHSTTATHYVEHNPTSPPVASPACGLSVRRLADPTALGNGGRKMEAGSASNSSPTPVSPATFTGTE